MPDNLHWVGTWATAPAPAESGAFNNHTLRMNARVSLGGDTTARARLERLWQPQLLDRRRRHRQARHRLRGGAGLEQEADLRRHRNRHGRRGRLRAQRPGRVRSRAAVAMSRSASICPSEMPAELRDHRPLCAADQLHLAAGRLQRRGGDAGRQHHQRLVLRQRDRCSGRAGDRRRGRARRLADRRQHLDARRLLPLARPALPPAPGARAAAGRWG